MKDTSNDAGFRAPPKTESTLLAQGSPRCLCVICGLYFKNEDAFTAHQDGGTRPGCLGTNESALRGVGLRTASIRGSEVLEWTL